MGCKYSVSPNIMQPKWRIKHSREESRIQYEKEGSIPIGCGRGVVDFRTLLDIPYWVNVFGEYIKTTPYTASLLCWNDILLYRSIENTSTDYLSAIADRIYTKYLSDNASHVIQDIPIPPNFRQLVHSLVESDHDNADLTPALFDGLQRQILVQLYVHAYRVFKSTSEHKAALRHIKLLYNNVEPNDFIYLEELGQSSFGCVVRCRKKSTNKEYAMKIQSKIELLENAGISTHRVMHERDALVRCNHPFIVGLHYGFQTQTHVMLVCSLGIGGTLAQKQRQFDGFKVDPALVKFYCAEIILALFHIHRLGMIYRDLKPQNVVLDAAGHAQIIDMGVAVDVGGLIFEMHEDEESAIYDHDNISRGSQHYSYLDTRASVGNKASHSKISSENDLIPRRATSFVGTCGYMAPEVMILMDIDAVKQRKTMKGYTKAVDFWSLGVMMFDMLTGHLPFRNSEVAGFIRPEASLKETFLATKAMDVVSCATSSQHDLGYVGETTNKGLSGYDLSILSTEFPDCSIIEEFLNVNELERLGSGSRGEFHIRKHPYFRGISWSKLVRKQIAPPCTNAEKGPMLDAHCIQKYANYEEMLSSGEGAHRIMIPTNADQIPFKYWDYVSPHVLNEEMGLSAGNG